MAYSRDLCNKLNHIRSKIMKRVDCWFDESGDTAGWFCEVTEGGEYKMDSAKIWFPVDVDLFSKEREDDLISALEVEFPEHLITLR